MDEIKTLENDERTIIIKRFWLAKKLLKAGFRIVDIVMARNGKYINFVFENEDNFVDKMNELINEKHENWNEQHRYGGYTNAKAVSPEDLMKQFDEIKEKIEAVVANNQIIK